MRKFMATLVCLLAGCTGTAIFEMYNEHPIEIECAKSALDHSSLISSTKIIDHAIEFTGRGFDGELFHGGVDEPFSNFGLEISSGGLFSKSPVTIADELSVVIRQRCGAK